MGTGLWSVPGMIPAASGDLFKGKFLGFSLPNPAIIGSLPETVIGQINQLLLPALEELGEALLDFSEMDDLVGWLHDSHQPE